MDKSKLPQSARAVNPIELETFIHKLLQGGWDAVGFTFVDPTDGSGHFAYISSLTAENAGELARTQRGRLPVVCYYVTFDILNVPDKIPLEICRARMEFHPNVGVIAATLVERASIPQIIDPMKWALTGVDKVLLKLKGAYKSGLIRDAKDGEGA